MSLALKYMEGPKFLTIIFEGEWTEFGMKNSIQDISHNLERHDTKKILFDLQNLSLPANDMIRFYTGEQLAQSLRFYKIAGFAQAEKINRFAENVAVNRGAHFKMFINEFDAIDWLISDD